VDVKRYQVFVSSTFEDLKEERQKVIQAILKAGCIPVGMEYFPAADEEQFSYIKRVIDSSDYCVLLVGGRYGTRAPDKISYTEKEYAYAKKRGLKVIALLGSPRAGRPRQSPKDMKSLEAFRKKLLGSRLVERWNTIDQLEGMVSRNLDEAIKQYPARGWTRATLPMQDRTDFLKFFGPFAETDGVLVVGRRELRDPTRDPFDYPFRKKLKFEGNGAAGVTRTKFPRPEGVSAWLAYEDIRAGAALGTLFGRVTGDFLKVRLDGDAPKLGTDKATSIAMGLGFTVHTRMILEPLLRRGFLSICASQEGDLYTDFFKIEGKRPRPAEGHDVALVARVLAPDSNHPHFVCAGRSAAGTAAAGRWLASHWRDLLTVWPSNSRGPHTEHLLTVLQHPKSGSYAEDIDACAEPLPGWTFAIDARTGQKRKRPL